MYRIINYFFLNRRNVNFNSNNGKAILLFLLLFWFATSGFLYFELPAKPDLNWLDAAWWAIVTMTTVGYGDYFPISTGGRYLIGIPTMIFGIGFLGFIISEVTSILIESRSLKLRGKVDIQMKNHILIINFNRIENVLRIIEELKSDPSTKNKEICLIDETLEELPKELIDFKLSFISGNPTQKSILDRANSNEATHAIVLSKDPENPHSDDQNLAITLVLKNLNQKLFSIVEVIDPKKINQIELAGCDSAICVSELTANLVIQELQDSGVKDIIVELTSNTYGKQIYLIPIKNMKTWKFKELVLWGLENRYSVLGLVKEKKTMLNCNPDEKVESTDSVILIGSKRIKSISC